MGWTHFRSALGQEPPRWAYPHWARGRRSGVASIIPEPRAIARRASFLDRVADALAARQIARRPVLARPRELGEVPTVSRWQLPVPLQVTTGGPLAANVILQGSRQGLLESDRPSAMQEWRLRSLSVPLGVFAKPEAGEHTAGTAVVLTVLLRRSGDVVWNGAGETRAGPSSGEAVIVRNLQVTAQFEAPIALRAGQSLTLEAFASCPEALKTLTFALAGRFSGSGGTAEGADGVIDYEAVPMTGFREL